MGSSAEPNASARRDSRASGSALLGGLRVLDLSSVGPAARCSRILADYGAQLVKIAAPPRRGASILPPFHAYAAHRDMQRICLDLKSAQGRAVLLRLAECADAVIESFRPGVADRLGVGYEDLCGVNPSIVYCSTSGYGQTGPYAGWAGHDLNYLALGGFLACTQPRDDGGPPIPGATVADAAGGGMHAAMAILAALLRRATTGEGAYLDVSAAEGVLQLMSLHIDEHLATGVVPGPGSNILIGRYACYELYRCRDGKWLAVGAIEARFFANLCGALGLEEWVPHQLDDARQDEIRSAFRAAFATRDRDAWVVQLGPTDTCVSPVYAVDELVDDPHLSARGVFRDVEVPGHGRLRQLGRVLAGADRDGPTRIPEPGGTDADALLGDAGFSASEIEKLRSEGTVA